MSDPKTVFSEDMREYVFSAEAGQSAILTLEIYHPAIVDENGDPFTPRVANWDRDIIATLEADAPRNGGAAVSFMAATFDFVFAGSPEQGLPSASVEIDNVVSYLTPWLKAATEQAAPVQIIAREYLADDLSEPSSIMSGVTADNVRATLVRVTADLSFEDLLNSAFPPAIYRTDEFRGLVR
jgi:hypothetical protein